MSVVTLYWLPKQATKGTGKKEIGEYGGANEKEGRAFSGVSRLEGRSSLIVAPNEPRMRQAPSDKPRDLLPTYAQN